MIKKTTNKNTASEKKETKTTNEDNLVTTQIDQNAVQVKVKRAGDYGKWGIEISRTVSLKKDEVADEIIDSLIGTLTEKVIEYAESDYVAGIESGSCCSSKCESEEESEEEEVEAPEEEEEQEITEEYIRGLSKKELIKFIEEYNVEIDADEYKKLNDLRDAVVAAALGEEESEEESEEEFEEEESEDGITPDDIRKMERKALIELIKDNDLEIDPKEYKKLGDLQDAIIDMIGDSEEEESEEESEESEEEMTPDDVREMDKEGVIALIKEHSLKVKPKEFKKLNDLKEAIIEELFGEEGEEEFGDFDDVDFE